MATAADSVAAPPALSASPWLLDLPRDLLLFIATPLLLIPVFALLRQSADDAAIYAVVASFGATGHHLPGLLRAYGDRALFAKYRLRFVLGPILLATLCLAMKFGDLRGITFLTITWGTWHGLAQVYGLGRIYDARTGYFSARAAALDKALCLVWFVGGLLLASGRSADLLEELYKCGIPQIPAAAVSALYQLWLAAIVAVTLLWLAQFVRDLRGAGARPNPAKAAVFASSIAWWWYATVPAEHAIVGLALFEVFHDVQYLTIVWIYNRKLAQKGRKLGAFNHFVFEVGPARVLLYLALVAAYGAADFVGIRVTQGAANQALAALVLCSGFLHFYYDSFIWNLRDEAVRRDLEVTPATPIAPASFTPPAWLAHAWNWSWLAVPLGALLVAQQISRPSELEWRERLVATLPESAVALERLASTYRAEERYADALPLLERAVLLVPDAPKVFSMLGELRAQLGDLPGARSAFEEAASRDPRDVGNLVNLGLALQRAGKPDAEAVYRRALALDASLVQARTNLALILAARGEREAGRAELQRALAEVPSYAPAWFNLGMLALEDGRPAEAVDAFEGVLRIDPQHPGARKQLPLARAALAATGGPG
jgi:tetratricopeptide (TPR) repeat protein